MPSPHAIITDISEQLTIFVSARRDEIDRDDDLRDDPIASLLVDHAGRALRGGKRLRARYAFWGWRAATAADGDPPAGVLELGAALEAFQAAALVHDDIVDNSDTRRGAPSAWRGFEDEHRSRNWHGLPREFGRHGAILLGDLLLGWSDDLFETALTHVDDVGTRRAARAVYARMRRDVIVGQFLDVAEEVAWPRTPDEDHATRALRIAVLKSARYSVQQPLLLGAAYGGADEGVRDALSSIGRPLGLAFQLRDDVLGAFGDPSVTGKPTGGDLREGKRTVLVAYTREAMDPPARAAFDARLGAEDLTDSEIAAMQRAIRDTGARDRVERMIQESAEQARDILAAAPIDPATADELTTLITATTTRSS